MSPGRFCTFFLFYAITIVAFIAVFNIAVDPYLVFGTARQAGWNDLKPAAATHERILKTYDSPRNPARTVILGSSRTDIGLDPQHAVWPSQYRPVYNLSLVGSGLDTQLLFLRHLVAARPASETPRTVIVGLDFEAFLFRPGTGQRQHGGAPNDETEQRLLVLHDGSINAARGLQRLKDFGASALSLDALSDSLATLSANRFTGDVNVSRAGHFSERGFRHTTDADGVAALFGQKNAETVAKYANPRQVLSDVPGGPIAGLQSVSDLIVFAKQHGIKLILAIQPAHASRLSLLTKMGYWPDYERWKHDLTMLAASEHGADVTLWDFGGYEEYALETVPAEHNRTSRLRWFWDPVHYTSELGDLITGRMLGSRGLPDYGVALTPLNLEQRLAQVRQQRQRAKALVR